jgi:phosphatidylglycerophosphatase A
VSAAERLNGGLGVVADDMVAGLFAGLIVSAASTLGAI